jgi:hypothetical protein
MPTMRASTLGILALAAALGLAGCSAPTPRGPGAFTFAVVGDTPYSDAEERKWLDLIGRVNATDIAFTIHVGDIKGGGPCSDEIYARRRAQFDSFAKPLIYTPGDNEWTDCRRKHMGSMDPIERLARLRQVFFADRWSLGASRLWLDAQDACLVPPAEGCGCAAHPENRAWTFNGIRFATLNIPGSDNNVGYDAANDREARCRDEANRRWLQAQEALSAQADVRALVVAIQANPWDSRKPVYRGFLQQVEAAAMRLSKPVLFIHGDTHTYQFDSPFRDEMGHGRRWPRRLETSGSPFVGWVKVTVDPTQPDPFAAEPKLEAFVPPV